MGRKVSRERAVTALVSSPSIKAAASACGISEKTLHQWLKDPEFTQAVKAAHEATTKAAMRRVVATANAAVSVLQDIMQDATIQPSTRVTAARTLLDSAIKIRETLDLENRITLLEQTLEGRIL